jgi:hypothetical protein
MRRPEATGMVCLTLKMRWLRLVASTVQPDRAGRVGHVARRRDRRCVLRVGAAGKQQGQGDGQQATDHRQLQEQGT